MQDKKNWNFIFHGIGRDFEEFWDTKKKDYSEDKREEAKKDKWNQICEWIDKYSLLIYSVIPKSKTACMIETKQEYADFSKEEILCVIEKLGKVSQLMYCADRDIFGCVYSNKKLERYYIGALEQITWLTASFVNLEKNYCNFIDLRERLDQIITKGGINNAIQTTTSMDDRRRNKDRNTPDLEETDG